MVINLLGILFFSIILIKAADTLAVHLKAYSRKTKIGGYVLTTLAVSLATSLPELFVGITSALSGVPNISLGNAIGSNIANMTFVAGGAALLAGGIKIQNHSYARDLLHAFMAGLAPLFLLMDNVLSRVDALILISLYAFYNYDILKNRSKQIVENEESSMKMFIRKLVRPKTGKHLMYMFLSIAVILFAADMIVRFGMAIAEGFNISVLLVGLFFVAIGTSLPEFVVEYKAIKKNDPSLFVGNLLGSMVANGTLIIGITALISPITIQAFNDYLLATLFFLLIFFFFYFYVRTRQRLDRVEGLILVIIYLIFILLEFNY